MNKRKLAPRGNRLLPSKSFYSSFEAVSDFNGYYIVPQGAHGSTHYLDPADKYHGSFSHRAEVVQANDIDNDSTPEYLPHRAYPTVQMYKTGIFNTPCLITMYVKVSMALQERAGVDDWLSLITTTCTPNDNWDRTVLCNLTTDGYLRLVHVPNQGEQTHIYQVNSTLDPSALLVMPQNTWFRLDMYVDFSSTSGRAIVWQNKIRVSEALVNGGNGNLAQYHGGLYCGAAISTGTVWNDKLRILEVRDRAHAESYVGDSY